jgi:hypothetical protein
MAQLARGESGSVSSAGSGTGTPPRVARPPTARASCRGANSLETIEDEIEAELKLVGIVEVGLDELGSDLFEVGILVRGDRGGLTALAASDRLSWIPWIFALGWCRADEACSA